MKHKASKLNKNKCDSKEEELTFIKACEVPDQYYHDIKYAPSLTYSND